MIWVVVNGKLLGEQKFDPKDVEGKPKNLNMLIGLDDEECENTGKITNLNVFSSVLAGCLTFPNLGYAEKKMDEKRG